jgi:Phage integrase family
LLGSSGCASRLPATGGTKPLTGWRITERRLRPLLRREGLPPIRFHDLHHTAATLIVTAGVNPKVVSEMLGHTDVAITLDRYSHRMPTMQAEAVHRLDGVLSGRLRVRRFRGHEEAPIHAQNRASTGRLVPHAGCLVKC